jgi:hypothetical protein
MRFACFIYFERVSQAKKLNKNDSIYLPTVDAQ